MKYKIVLLVLFLSNNLLFSQITDPRDFRPSSKGWVILIPIIIFLIWGFFKRDEKREEEIIRHKKENDEIKRKEDEHRVLRKVEYEREKNERENTSFENSKKYYELVTDCFWDKNTCEWKNYSYSEIRLDLLLKKYPESKNLQHLSQKSNELIYNFEEFWRVFPFDTTFDGNFSNKYAIRSRKNECERMYNELIEKGIKHEYIIITLKSEINYKIKRFKENSSNYIIPIRMKNSLYWLTDLCDYGLNWDSIILHDYNQLLIEMESFNNQ